MTDVGTQQIRRKPILNGLINEYTHAAWRTEDLQVTQPNPIFERDRIELHRLVRRRLRSLRVSRFCVPPIQAPRMNAICERLAGTLRREVFDRMLIVGEAHLRAVLAEYQAPYNAARPHQGIEQHVPDDDRDPPRAAVTDLNTQRIRRRSVLNGLINEYTPAA